MNETPAQSMKVDIRPELGVTAVMLPELDFDEQIDLCTQLGLKYYQYRPRVVPPERQNEPYANWGRHKFDLTPAMLHERGAALTDQLRAAGIEPWGAVPTEDLNNTDEQLAAIFDACVQAELHCVRCNPLRLPEAPFDYGDYLSKLIQRYRHVIDTLARPRGLKLIFETHYNSCVCSPGLAYAVAREFDPQSLGVIFDLPNFAREGEVQPELAVAVLKPWIDCVHVGGARRISEQRDSFGGRIVHTKFCPLPESDINVANYLNALRRAGVAAPWLIEEYSNVADGTQKLRDCAAYLDAIRNQPATGVEVN